MSEGNTQAENITGTLSTESILIPVESNWIQTKTVIGLIWFVHLIRFVQPNKQDEPNKRDRLDQPDRPAPCRTPWESGLETAKAESKNKSQLFREMLMTYERRRREDRFLDLQRYGVKKARKKGILTEADVEG